MADTSQCMHTATIPLLLSMKGTMTLVGLLLSGIHNCYEIPFVSLLKAEYLITQLKTD